MSGNQSNAQPPPPQEATNGPLEPVHPNNPPAPLVGAQLPPNLPLGAQPHAPQNIVAANPPVAQVIAPVAPAVPVAPAAPAAPAPPFLALGASPLLRSLYGRPLND